jgi:hypothetical protein
MNYPPLTNPDAMHFQAAEGWLGLGNHLEANEELEMITPTLRAHPDVLEMRWHVSGISREGIEPGRFPPGSPTFMMASFLAGHPQTS